MLEATGWAQCVKVGNVAFIAVEEGFPEHTLDRPLDRHTAGFRMADLIRVPSFGQVWSADCW